MRFLAALGPSTAKARPRRAVVVIRPVPGRSRRFLASGKVVLPTARSDEETGRRCRCAEESCMRSRGDGGRSLVESEGTREGIARTQRKIAATEGGKR